VRESRPPGSVRGVRRNAHLYRDKPIAQTCCQRKSNGNGLLQRRLQGFRPLPSTLRKRSFPQLEVASRLLTTCRLPSTNR